MEEGHACRRTYFSASVRTGGGRVCNRTCVSLEREHGDREEKGFGEPEGVIAEARGGPGPEDGSAEEAEADEAKVACLGEALFAGFGSGVWSEGLVEAFGYVAQIAGDERGVIGEAVYAAEAGD